LRVWRRQGCVVPFGKFIVEGDAHRLLEVVGNFQARLVGPLDHIHGHSKSGAGTCLASKSLDDVEAMKDNALPGSREVAKQVDVVLKNSFVDIKENKDISDSIIVLKKLKSKYIDIYLGMHNRVRLNASEDNRKQKLLYDKKINALRQLKEIDILPGNKCDEFIDKITRMKTCWNLTKEKLEGLPICSDCEFKPKEEKFIKPFNLEELEDELNNLLETWTSILITTFKNPKIKKNINLLTEGQKGMVSTLIKGNMFELPIDISLIETIKELFHGIEKIEISIDELKNLMGNGNPLTLNDVKERFDSFINNKMSSMDEHNTRFVLKQKTDKQSEVLN